jgi:FMN phosphatase YigB (HAD superfamily)
VPKIYSYDVFDTVVTRTVLDPTHVHWGVAGTARARGWFDYGDKEWRRLRVAAEAEARGLSGGEEVRLRDIYQRIQAKLGCDDASADRLRALEVSFEHKLSSPVQPAWRDVIARSARGDTTVFISDTYLCRPDVATLLAQSDWACDPENVYVSSEYGASKARGDLFAVVAARRRSRCADMLHQGDNYVSDVLNARLAGMAAKQLRVARTNVYERILQSHGGDDYVGSVVAGAARATRLRFTASFPANPGLTDVSASVAGPLLMAFVLWILCEAKDRGLDRLFFLARDGQILAKIASRIAEWAGFPIDCQYLLASRQAFYLSSLPHTYEEAVGTILQSAAEKTVGTVLAELETQPETAHDAMARAKLTGTTLIASEASLRSLRALLLDPDIATPLHLRIVERSNALIAYLRGKGFLSAAPAGIVDLGWQGNLQLRLERSVAGHAAMPPIGFYYGLYRRDPSLDGRVLTFCPTPVWHNQLLETMCLADHGSVRGFLLDADGSVRPMIDQPADDEAISWGVHAQQEVILAYVAAVTTALDPASVSPGELLERMRSGVQAVLARLIAAPSRPDAEAYGSAVHAADQAHQTKMEIAPALGTPGIVRSIVSNAYRSRTTSWPQGVIARSSGSVPARLIHLLLRLRFHYKFNRGMA